MAAPVPRSSSRLGTNQKLLTNQYQMLTARILITLPVKDPPILSKKRIGYGRRAPKHGRNGAQGRFADDGEYRWHNYFRSGLSDTNDQHTISAFIQDQLTLLDTNLVAMLALRLDYVANTRSDSANSGVVPSPKLSLLYRPVDMLGVRFSLGRGFKAPTVMELYEDRNHLGRYYRIGNTQLQPEYSTNLALGCDVSPFK
jgi:outer membrane receptor protein involved in Fe transport